MAQGKVESKAKGVPGMTNPGSKWPLLIGVVGSNTEYARALELGYKGRNLEPRPYLRPALEKATPALKQIFGIG